MIDFLSENFKMKLNGFHSHATNIGTGRIFEDPFSIEVNDAPEKSLNCSVTQFWVAVSTRKL
jgi:hypothetical protein